MPAPQFSWDAPPSALRGWLAQTAELELVQVGGGKSWEVWASNGQPAGDFFEGAVICECDSVGLAELVLDALRLLKGVTVELDRSLDSDVRPIPE